MIIFPNMRNDVCISDGCGTPDKIAIPSKTSVLQHVQGSSKDKKEEMAAIKLVA